MFGSMTGEKCPKCGSENAYEDGGLWVCPECFHEWTKSDAPAVEAAVVDTAIRDANGNVLTDGDAVTVVKDLKIKGASSTVKSGTKIRNIRLIDAVDGHNIACKIDGVGTVNLKSEFVKKA